jgi:hypothetical protein
MLFDTYGIASICMYTASCASLQGKYITTPVPRHLLSKTDGHLISDLHIDVILDSFLISLRFTSFNPPARVRTENLIWLFPIRSFNLIVRCRIQLRKRNVFNEVVDLAHASP